MGWGVEGGGSGRFPCREMNEGGGRGGGGGRGRARFQGKSVLRPFSSVVSGRV